MITAGVDVGSSSSKVVIIKDGQNILSKVLIPIGTGTSGPFKAFERALAEANVSRSDIAMIVATGYGRNNFPAATHQVSEITCHARGAYELFPHANTVIDIGGQDAKAIRISPGGAVENFVMNDKCAAGTGRFLDVMSRILEVDVSGLADLADKSTREIAISNICTVFAESEVISQLSAGSSREDVAAGIVKSVIKRVSGLAHRVGIKPEVVMTGGVSLNWAAVKYLQEELQTVVLVSPYTQFAGALGAALLACQMRIKK